MAHMNPSNSRAMAVAATLLSLPRAVKAANRLCSRCCAFQAIRLASSLSASDFCRLRPGLEHWVDAGRSMLIPEAPGEDAHYRFSLSFPRCTRLPLVYSLETRPL
jgi:hypothetical protein